MNDSEPEAEAAAVLRPPHRRIPTPAVAVLSLVAVLLVAVGGERTGPGTVLLGLAAAGSAWALSRVVRERREHAAYTAQQLASQAVVEERLRIARELHDVVAHSMSVITVKAGIAHHVLRERPEEAADALQVIEISGRNALTEMRRLLGVLRSERAPDRNSTAADLEPSPSLADVPALAERARTMGVDVDLQVHVHDDLPDGVELSMYRIVQETLTNVVKHAAPAACEVRIHAAGGTASVDVRDDGARGRRQAPRHPAARHLEPRHGATGHGLIGMHERVVMYGGTFAAGPRPDGGFEVSAVLHYRPASGSPANETAASAPEGPRAGGYNGAASRRLEGEPS